LFVTGDFLDFYDWYTKGDASYKDQIQLHNFFFVLRRFEMKLNLFFNKRFK